MTPKHGVIKSQRAMVRRFPKSGACQACACPLGMFAAFTPGVSFKDLFTGMDYMRISGFVFFGTINPGIRVPSVHSGSPAKRAGFPPLHYTPTNQ